MDTVSLFAEEYDALWDGVLAGWYIGVNTRYSWLRDAIQVSEAKDGLLVLSSWQESEWKPTAHDLSSRPVGPYHRFW